MKMPKDEIDINMFAPCGMNCIVCYRYCYHKKPCAGCLNSDKGKPKHCRTCKIKNCIKKKSLSYCFECVAFPCKLIKNLEKSYNKRYGISLIENSEYVRQYGLKKFMEEQKAKYTCAECDGVISIHGKECSECQFIKKERFIKSDAFYKSKRNTIFKEWNEFVQGLYSWLYLLRFKK